MWKANRQLPPQTHRDAWVEINLNALEHNANWFKANTPHNNKHLMAVIKADAYGHGATMVVPVLQAAGFHHVAVASMDEALPLREAGLETPILILGAFPSWAIPMAQQNALTLTLFQAQHLEWLSQALHQNPNPKKPLTVHIKIDTGMHRLGVPWQEASPFISCIQALQQQYPKALKLEGLYSHLACGETLEPTQQQWERFQWVLQHAPKPLPSLLHLSNTAGLSTLPTLPYKPTEIPCNMVRIGLGLYGYGHPALKPVMGLKARIVHLQTLPAGEGVSYGHTFTTHHPTTLATLPLGYADGLPRGLSGKLQALVNGQLVPQVGRITMDQLMLDITDVTTPVNPGDTVTLLSHEAPFVETINLTAWANTLDTIEYELMCGLRLRLPKVYVRS